MSCSNFERTSFMATDNVSMVQEFVLALHYACFRCYTVAPLIFLIRFSEENRKFIKWLRQWPFLLLPSERRTILRQIHCWRRRQSGCWLWWAAKRSHRRFGVRQCEKRSSITRGSCKHWKLPIHVEPFMTTIGSCHYRQWICNLFVDFFFAMNSPP